MTWGRNIVPSTVGLSTGGHRRCTGSVRRLRGV